MSEHTGLSDRQRAVLDALRAKRERVSSEIPRRGPAHHAPMSSGQQRLWYLDRLGPGNLYLLPMAYRIEGSLHVDVLARALNALVARHESLRTTFAVGADGELVQTVAEELPVELPVLDADPAELPAALAAEADQPMDLATGPLLRAKLLRHGPATHVLLLTLHHIVGDGWSFGVLHGELGELYAALLGDRAPVLAELPMQYADFAVWQRDRDHAEQLAYWRTQLDGAPAAIELDGGRTRPPEQTFAGRTVPVRLPGLADGVRALCRRLGATPFMVLLAVYQVLLARYTDTDDIVVGTTTANRDRPELEGLIGFFVNTVVIRLDLTDNPTFADVVARVHEATVGAYGHQELPFEQLVDVLNPERRLDRSPLFQHAFLYPVDGDEPLALPGLTVIPLELPSQTSKFDLTMSLSAGRTDVEGHVEYSADLFEQPWIDRFFGHYGTLLAAAVGDPDAAVWSTPLAGPEPAEAVAPWALPERVHDLHAEWSTSDSTAVVAGDVRISHAELAQRSDAWARRLVELGAGRGTVVAICLPRSTTLATAVLAVLKAGAAYLPLDPTHPADRLRGLIADAGVRLVIGSAGLAPADLDRGGSAPDPVVGPDDLAYVMYTSGSTGRPKGVMITHRGLANYVEWARREYVIGPGDEIPLHGTVSADLSVTSLLVPLLAGATVRMLPDGIGAADLGEELRSGGFGLVKTTPAHLQILTRQLTDAEPAGRVLVLGGENLLAEHVAPWRGRLRLINEYGPTETVVGCAVHEVDDSSPSTGSIPIGRPIANTRLYVLDRRLNPVPDGAVGELYVGGAGVARGYLDRPDLTAERFLPDPFVPGERVYRTGDLVRRTADGELVYLGRRDDQVKVRGYRTELGEVEAALARQPGVREAAVVLRDHRLIGYVVGGDHDVLTALKAELPDYMVPSVLVPMAELPLTPQGKVDRAALPAPTTSKPVAGGGSLARTVAEVWHSVLGTSAGHDDNFFDAGGNSLLLLRVHSRLVEVVGDRLEVTDLFRYPTIRALAEFLGQGERDVMAPVTRPSGGDAIAVIGMACRFPGGRTPEEFWRSIRDGVEAVRTFSVDEARADGADPELLDDPNYVLAGTVLPDIDRFDETAFDFTPREAQILDPQQRLLLECSWEALERAGNAGPGAARVGVFAGSASSSYLTENLLTSPEVRRSVGPFQLHFATERDFLATQVSYRLNLRGPSLTVNTACSTSLVAVHLARQSLLAGDCDVALAGGVNVDAAQRRGYLAEEGGPASADGCCRPFDAEANGSVSASGAGVVVLKRLQDAIADGDPIHAVLRGSAINNDGAGKVGFAAPGVDGQAEVIEAALAAAGVSPRSVGYVEAHGTATRLGDPVEIAALTKAYRRHTDDRQFCAIGSVKANIGHAGAAAGVAGLIKAIQALRHRTLPPAVNFRRPNPVIDFAGSPFYVNTESRPWTAADGPRRAAVSSFGMGGTNAHVVLEEAPAPAPADPSDDPELLVLSARTAGALDAMTGRLGDHLAAHPEVPLADVAWTLRTGRRALEHRRAVAIRDLDDAVDALRDADPGRTPSGVTQSRTPGIAFVFPGQGSQHTGMGDGLYRQEPVFREIVDHCAEVLGFDLRAALRSDSLNQTRLTQPALFVTEYALARTLIERGVRPTAMAGHSVGEFVAACLAGVFPLDEAVRLVAARGRLMQELPAGSMLAVALREPELAPLLPDDVSIAAVNAPAMCVLSGPTPAIAELAENLGAQGVHVRPLRTSHAFHSAAMDPVLDEFTDLVAAVGPRVPDARYLSGVTGTWITAEQATDPRYWARQLREPVRFADCAKSLVDEDMTVVEVGPGRGLSTFVRQQGGDAVPLMRPRDADESVTLLDGIGRIWLTGAEIDWSAFSRPRRKAVLPTYPFERRRHWVEPGGRLSVAGVSQPVETPVTGELESELAALWSDVLGVDSVAPDADFFQLGGHSLAAMQVLARVRAQLGVRIGIDTLFAAPSVTGLAAAVRRAGGQESPAAADEPATTATAPLSYGQRRLWFLAQAHPESLAHILAAALELTGPLDLDKLRAAVTALVRRHEALRTVLPVVDGEPTQVVQSPSEVDIVVVDTDDPDANMWDLTRIPFDLAAGPLFRATLLRTAPDRHILLVCMHHVVSDGWTLGLICDEVCAHYSGRPVDQPASYREFTLAQRRELPDRLPSGLAYWTNHLRGVPPSLELPTDRPRPAMQTFVGATESRLLPAEFADELRRVSADHGATLYMTMMAALQVVVHRYTGATDFCVGTSVAGHTDARFDGTVGFFVNTVALRGKLAGDRPLRAVLAQAKGAALGAFANQDVPFELVVDELDLPRDLSRPPLFQVMLTVLNLPGHELRADGLVARRLPLSGGTSEVDIAVFVYDRAGALECIVEYNTDLYDAATAARLLDHYENVLRQFVVDPDRRVRDVAIMTADELHREIVEWNATGEPLPDCGIHDLVTRQALLTPDATAVTFDGTSSTYREVEQVANRIAHRLRAAGVGPDTLVAVAVDRTQWLPATLLGVLKAGGGYLPLDAMYPRERLRHILDDARPTVLLADHGRDADFPWFDGVVVSAAPDGPEPTDAVESGVGPANIAYVLYTSGSTGRPKGVRVPHRAVVNFLRSMAHAPGLDATATLVAESPYAFDISVLELFLPLTVGARVVVASREDAHDPVRLAALVDAERATFLQATPATWQLLVASGWRGRPGLTALTGGDRLPRQLAEALLARVGRLWTAWGPTETTIYSTTVEVRPGDVITIGHPIANTGVYVLDDETRPLPVGVTGELYIGGDGLARDYLGQPALTAEKFVPDPFGAPGARLYRSGDLGRRRPDGAIEFVGRNDNQVKLRGYRIELGEIEALLRAQPSVRQAAAVVFGEGDDRAIAAYVVADEFDEAALRAQLRAALPEYMVPSVLVSLDRFPLTPNGKLDRKALPAPSRPRPAAGSAPAETPTQRLLAERWSELLGVAEIGIDDNFFDLGGDSFKAVPAVRGLPGVAILDLFKNPTVRRLAAHLDGPAAAESWLLHELTPARPDREFTLVCLPFAAAGAATYQPLADALPETVSLYALQPPGHDFSRPGEPLLPLRELAARCVTEIKARITGPIALYGHCIGGALTVELARQLEAADVPITRIYVGGHFPTPRLPGKLAALTRRVLPVERWTSRRLVLESVRAMGFYAEALTPSEQEFLMLAFFSDTEAGELYYTDVYRDAPPKLAAPITAVIGEADRATQLYQERVAEWSSFSDSVSLETIPGAGHYFQKHQAAELATIVAARRDQPAAVAPARTGIRTFLAVALGQLVSLIGSGLTTFAMSVWVFQQTHSVSLFAVAAVAGVLPAVLFAPIAGAVADRVNRRLVMIGADSFAALGPLLLAVLLWTDDVQLWQIYLVVVISATATAFQLPAYLAAVTQLVPKRYFGRANGLVQLGSAAGPVLSPVLGGALVVAAGLPGVVVVDLVTFLFAISVTAVVRFPDAMFVRREEPFLQELSGGWRFVTRRRGLVTIIVFTALLNFLFGLVELLVTPLTLAMGDPTVLGAVLAASGLGLLVGSALMTVWGGWSRRMTGILASFLLVGLSMVVIGLRPDPLFPALGMFGLGLATATLNAHWLAIVQTKVGLELQSRVIATTLMGSWLMVPLGFLVAGPAVQRAAELLGADQGRGIALVVVVAGVACLLLALAAYRNRHVRLLEDELPDAVPDAVVITDKDAEQERLDAALAGEERA